MNSNSNPSESKMIKWLLISQNVSIFEKLDKKNLTHWFYTVYFGVDCAKHAGRYPSQSKRLFVINQPVTAERELRANVRRKQTETRDWSRLGSGFLCFMRNADSAQVIWRKVTNCIINYQWTHVNLRLSLFKIHFVRWYFIRLYENITWIYK